MNIGLSIVQPMTKENHAAPRSAEDFLDRVRVAYPEGLPNLFRTLQGNPAAVAGFIALDLELEAHGRLSATERLLVGLMTARDVGCEYCRAALSKEARNAGAPDQAVDAVLEGRPPEDRRIRTLAQATSRLLELRGRLPKAEIAHFRRCGLTEADLLEVISVVGLFTIATYANNLMRTRIDPEYHDAAEPE